MLLFEFLEQYTDHLKDQDYLIFLKRIWGIIFAKWEFLI